MKPLALAALAATAFTLSGCGENLGKGQPLNVVSGHIVMGVTDDRPAVGYFKVEGGPQPVQLVAVTADLAQRVEMHESVRENGMVTMKPLARADVPAKGELVFKQGGKHLMIWGINGAAVRAGKLPMAFVFTNNNNERILFDMVIKPAEDAAAGGETAMDHSAMGHGGGEAAPDAAKK
ncbi:MULTISPECIES: copper chaperone PCu(A)C [unclassified Sphingopyxis]|uniref:copper chaperone PCu(A)C n=1 Tax=unclassified Sphingopyxis TaxID=2614943 RepID=UPI00285B8583|nr:MULTISPECIES: copper chaperone PCu(A)C [unclassified Sphingopyxis]MDR6833022.1 copper(I)-binding protein [Sphingopyxis sp. BE122]MDR7228765.1 copper(I)-binding protein [Sphingopyxis sp. BE259]